MRGQGPVWGQKPDISGRPEKALWAAPWYLLCPELWLTGHIALLSLSRPPSWYPRLTISHLSGLSLGMAQSSSLGWSMGICIPNKLPGVLKLMIQMASDLVRAILTSPHTKLKLSAVPTLSFSTTALCLAIFFTPSTSL